MSKIITGYSDYSADDLWHLGDTVVTNLPGIPIFATLKPTVAEITAQTGALETAINMHGPGRKQSIQIAFDALAELLGQVAVNAPQVDGVTDAPLAEIGLPLVQPPTRATNPPDAPLDLRLDHGALPGDLAGRFKAPPGNNRVFEAQWTLDPNGNTWSEIITFTNSRALRLSSLPRGKDVWVRVRARNSIGAGAWSDPATIMVT